MSASAAAASAAATFDAKAAERRVLLPTLASRIGINDEHMAKVSAGGSLVEESIAGVFGFRLGDVWLEAAVGWWAGKMGEYAEMFDAAMVSVGGIKFSDTKVDPRDGKTVIFGEGVLLGLLASAADAGTLEARAQSGLRVAREVGRMMHEDPAFFAAMMVQWDPEEETLAELFLRVPALAPVPRLVLRMMITEAEQNYGRFVRDSPLARRDNAVEVMREFAARGVLNAPLRFEAAMTVSLCENDVVLSGEFTKNLSRRLVFAAVNPSKTQMQRVCELWGSPPVETGAAGSAATSDTEVFPEEAPSRPQLKRRRTTPQAAAPVGEAADISFALTPDDTQEFSELSEAE